MHPALYPNGIPQQSPGLVPQSGNMFRQAANPGKSERFGFTIAQPKILPLLGGEGWGEGKWSHLHVDA